MKKAITLLAAVLAVSTVLTGCGKQPQQSLVSAQISKESSVDARSETSDEDDEEPPLIYAYGKEGIPKLAAKALTALGRYDEETFERCIGDEYIPEWEHYKSIHERIYRAVEKNSGDPSKKIACADFTVFQYEYNGEPNYYVYLNGCEKNFCIKILSRVNDIDKQEYYLEFMIEDIDDHFNSIERAQERVDKGELILIDLSQYENEEVNSNE